MDFYSSSKRIQSFEANLNELPLINVLSNAMNLFKDIERNPRTLNLVMTIEDNVGTDGSNIYIKCQSLLQNIRRNYLPYAEELMKPLILNAISDVQTELSRIRDLVGIFFSFD